MEVNNIPSGVDKPDLDIRNKRQLKLKLRKIRKIRKQLIKDIIDPTNNEEKRKPTKNRYIRDKNCPYSTSNGTVLESHYVWWKYHPEDEIIKYNEIIHHINLNPTDNRIENLIKMKSRDHRKLHGKLISKNNLKKWKKLG
jgi:hypothetical protein